MSLITNYFKAGAGKSVGGSASKGNKLSVLSDEDPNSEEEFQHSSGPQRTKKQAPVKEETPKSKKKTTKGSNNSVTTTPAATTTTSKKSKRDDPPWPELKRPVGRSSAATPSGRGKRKREAAFTPEKTTANDIEEEEEEKAETANRNLPRPQKEESKQGKQLFMDLVEEEDEHDSIESFPEESSPAPTRRSSSSKKDSPPWKEVQSPKKKKAKTEAVAAVTSASTPTNIPQKDTSAAASPRKGKGNPTAYHYWANRGPPPNLGGKEIPQGKPNCLYGKVFLFTGVLDSLERDDAIRLVEHYAGKVVKTTAKSLTHIVIGTEPGFSKLQKLEDRKDVVRLDEDGLLDLIRTAPEQKLSQAVLAKLSKSAKLSAPSTTPFQPSTSVSASTSTGVAPTRLPSPLVTANFSEERKKELKGALWADKHKPRATIELIGNPGVIKKLSDWLHNWDIPQPVKGGKGKATMEKGRPIRSRENGYNAVLLSGPPGIGKTSAAMLVARECGYTPIEFNASDVRSKKLIQTTVAQSNDNRSIGEFFAGTEQKNTEGKKACIIMDEVDGMSSGDRGGMAEIISMIKTSKIPIICLCNDRDSPKVRSLANHCLDLRFHRPTTLQIQKRVEHILQLEGMRVDPEALTRLIESVHGDVRQLLNLLQMWRVGAKNIGKEGLQERLQSIHKNVQLGPFDVIPKLLDAQQSATYSLSDKIDFYFVDYSLVPLLIFENYLHTRPKGAKGISRDQKVEKAVEMDIISAAVDSISDGDLMTPLIMGEQHWSLAPAHGVISTVRPASLVEGSLMARPSFPQYLAKFSTTKKNMRLLKEVSVHSSGAVSGTKAQLCLDYLPHMKRALSRPLIKRGADGIDEVIEFMDSYGLGREDWDSVMDLSKFSFSEDVSKKINKNLKTAFSKAYKATHTAVKRTTAKEALNIVVNEEVAAAGEEEDGAGLASLTAEDDEDEEEEDTGLDVNKLKGNPMIKVKPLKAATNSRSRKGQSRTADTKGKGKGKGKGKAK